MNNNKTNSNNNKDIGANDSKDCALGNNGDGQKGNENRAVILYKYVLELSKLIYENELRYEDSVIKQSSQMQTAFSFVNAALFAITPILLTYANDKLSKEFFLLAISSISFFLLLSLATATLAQWRLLTTSFPNISTLEDSISNDWERNLNEATRIKQHVDMLTKIQESKAHNNKLKVRFIITSMSLFLTALSLVVFWFIVGIIKII